MKLDIGRCATVRDFRGGASLTLCAWCARPAEISERTAIRGTRGDGVFSPPSWGYVLIDPAQRDDPFGVNGWFDFVVCSPECMARAVENLPKELTSRAALAHALQSGRQ